MKIAAVGREILQPNDGNFDSCGWFVNDSLTSKPVTFSGLYRLNHVQSLKLPG